MFGKERNRSVRFKAAETCYQFRVITVTDAPRQKRQSFRTDLSFPGRVVARKSSELIYELAFEVASAPDGDAFGIKIQTLPLRVETSARNETQFKLRGCRRFIARGATKYVTLDTVLMKMGLRHGALSRRLLTVASSSTAVSSCSLYARFPTEFIVPSAAKLAAKTLDNRKD